MEKEEEILRLLNEIRDTQQENHEEWMKARGESLLIQKKAVKKSNVFILFYSLIFAGLMIYWFFPFLPSSDYGIFQNVSYLEKEEHHEARQWLSTNKNVSPFAGNRFGLKENAVAFVEQLYDAGAETVYVTGINNEPGGPYADSIVVVLPSDKDKRKKLFEINRVEAEREGFDGMRDIGQKELFFWWD
jgi:hypothetical protein